MSLVKLLPTEESAAEINSYLASQGLPKGENLHSTVLYTEETPVFRSEGFEKKSASTYQLQLLRTVIG